MLAEIANMIMQNELTPVTSLGVNIRDVLGNKQYTIVDRPIRVKKFQEQIGNTESGILTPIQAELETIQERPRQNSLFLMTPPTEKNPYGNELVPPEIDKSTVMTKDVDNLEEEAKKYESAEEFVKAFNLFHGTPVEIEGGKLKFGAGQQLKKGGYMGGHFLTDQEQAAQAFQFGGQIYRASGKIKEKVFDVNKNKKVFKDFIGKKFKNQDEEMETFTQDHYDFMFPDGQDADWSTVYTDVVEHITKPKGFEGMKIKEYAGGVDANTYQLWQDEIPIYTKSQLTDIWNKANAQTDPLIEEAKKYGSADEFVASKDIWTRKDIEKATGEGELARLKNATLEEISVDKITGREDTRDRLPVGKRKIDTAIEVMPNAKGGYDLLSGNHRILQAIENGEKTIKAFVDADTKVQQLTDIWNKANKNK